MKSSIAAMISALIQVNPTSCTLALALTSDEEGPSEHGSKTMAQWLQKKNMHPACTLIIEPTSQHQFGDIIKTGRRGSLYANIDLKAKAHHVAYLPSSQNPMIQASDIITQLHCHFSDP